MSKVDLAIEKKNSKGVMVNIIGPSILGFKNTVGNVGHIIQRVASPSSIQALPDLLILKESQKILLLH